MSLESILLFAVALLAAATAWLYLRSRRRVTDAGESGRDREDLDTIAAWPPEATRVLTSGGRAAYEVLVKAVPECMVFSQVPLARYVRVPRRHSYAEWLARVGHLSADFLICDRASQVIAAVALKTSQDSEHALRRHARMTRVLKAAGIKVVVWSEHAVPIPAVARDQIMQRGDGASKGSPIAAEPGQGSERLLVTVPGKLPVAEVVAEVPVIDPALEPPSSTWFDGLDSGPAPRDPARTR